MSTLDARKNFAIVTAITGYDDAAVTITLVSGDGAKLPQPSTDGAFNLTWWNATGYNSPADDPDVEIVRCTARTGDVITIVRAQEGTTATVKSISDQTYKLHLGPTAKTITDIETVLDSKEDSANKGIANGYASLGSDGLVPVAQLPEITITDTFVVSSQIEMLALTAQTGDVAVRTDENKTYILRGTDPSVLADWELLRTPTDSVLSVNGMTGSVEVTLASIAAYSGTTAKSLYQMTSAIPVEFRSSDGNAILTLSETDEQILAGASGTFGSASLPHYSFLQDTNTGIYSAAADTIGFTTNGSARFLLTTSAFRSVGNGGISINYLAAQSATNPGYSIRGDENTGMYSDTADTLQFTTGGTLRATLNSTGLGIGTSPSASLHVNSDVTNLVAVFESTDSIAAFELKDNTGSSYMSTSSGGRISIGSVSSSSASNMNLLPTGSMALGTTFPSRKLHILDGTTYQFRTGYDASNYVDIGSDSAGGLVINPTGKGVGIFINPSAVLHLRAGTATANTAPLKFTSGTRTTTAEAGTMEFLAERFTLTPTSTARMAVNGTLFTQTADKTIANTVTETTLFGTGVSVGGGLTLPANFFVAGKTLKIHMHGFHSSTGNPNVTVTVKLGGTIVATGTGVSGNGATDGFYFDGEITCRTTGASGTVSAGGEFTEEHGSGLHLSVISTSSTTIDTTASQVLDVTLTWGTADAGNTITSQIAYVEVIN